MINKKTKRMSIIHKKINSIKSHDVNEAIEILKKLSITKFIESVDISVNLNVDTRKSDQNIRGTIVLPHGSGRNIRVAVFTQDVNIEKAKNAGADIVGMNNLSDQIKKGKFNFDIIIASPDTMHIVNQLGKILGPRGLMPNPKIGTVTTEISKTIKNIKSGQIFYRNDKNGIVHSTIGKINFESNKLKENLIAFLKSLKKTKPIQIKGNYIKKISLSTTMGGSIIINQDFLFSDKK